MIYTIFPRFLFITDITEKGGLSMELLLRNLHVNVMSKKSKNVEVLFMAAEASFPPNNDCFYDVLEH